VGEAKRRIAKGGSLLPEGKGPVDMVDKVALLLMMHFGDVSTMSESSLTCAACADFKESFCPGKGLSGEGVLDCMAQAAEKGIWS
jgi:hypothetical protein